MAQLEKSRVELALILTCAVWSVWGSIWVASAATPSGVHSFQPAIKPACGY